MKAKDLKQWQLFYNTNGYLCLVYKVENNKAHIVNYNGTFYAAKRDSEHEYSNEVPVETVEQFFMNFPLNKVENYLSRNSFNDIKKSYYIKEQKLNYKLLLII